MGDKQVKTTIDVYIEGLLVQSRDPEKIVDWAEAFGRDEITEELEPGFMANYHPYAGKKPWAHHFKDMNGYVIIRCPVVQKDSGCLTEILVSINGTDPNAPTLHVIANVWHVHFPVDYVASLVALARFYAVDNTILGDDSEKE